MDLHNFREREKWNILLDKYYHCMHVLGVDSTIDMYKEKSRPTWWIMSATLALHMGTFWPIIVHIMMASLLYSNIIFVQIRAWGHKIPFVGFYNSHVLFFVFPYKCCCLHIQIKLQDITFTKKQKKNWHKNTKTGTSKILKH